MKTTTVQSPQSKVQSRFENDLGGDGATNYADKRQLSIALAGNPNAGKTTLFNALTGMKQKIANYPGVTVEQKEGVWKLGEAQTARLIDLPGLYSLDVTSLDEQIAGDVLTGKMKNLPKPDVVVAVVDATNLERNLYLVTQLLEFKIPVVIALTMIDAAEKQSLEIDSRRLAELLQIPVVPVIAAQRQGIEQLSQAVIKAAADKQIRGALRFGESAESEEEIHLSLSSDAVANRKIFARYNFISDVYQESVKQKQTFERHVSDRIDGVLTHKFFGLVILIALLLFVFQA
ncbi:MAG TPA: FeoB small GTPase domain-containing protein, partial [Pyrinomonadaceae bacterium]